MALQSRGAADDRSFTMDRRHPVLVLVAVLFAAALAVPALAESPAEVAAPIAAAGAAGEAPLPIGESPLFTPEPEEKAPECHFCGGNFTTSVGGGPSHWGFGADCASAQADARAQLSSYVNADCQNWGFAGRCTFQVVYTCSCYQQGGQWVVDAYANYNCWIYYC